MDASMFCETQIGNYVASLGGNRYVCSKPGSMVLYACSKVPMGLGYGYKIHGESIVAGFIVKNMESFKSAVKILKPEEYEKEYQKG